MTTKRFTVHINWFNYDKTKGEIELKDNGQPLLLSESVEDVQYIKKLLNDLNDENEQLKQFKKQVKKELQESYELYVEATIVAPAVINNLAKRLGIDLND